MFKINHRMKNNSEICEFRIYYLGFLNNNNKIHLQGFTPAVLLKIPRQLLAKISSSFIFYHDNIIINKINHVPQQ